MKISTLKIISATFVLASMFNAACRAADAAAANTAPKPAANAKPAPKPREAQDASTPAPVNAGRQKGFLDRAKDKNIQLVFLGDSITDFWLTRGKAVWDQLMK